MGGAEESAGGRRIKSVGIIICCLAAIFLLAGGIPALSVPVDYLNFNDTNATIGAGPNPGDPVVETEGNGSEQQLIGGDFGLSDGAQSADDAELFDEAPPNQPADETVHFTVTADQPAYWRVTAYDRYLGDGWQQSGRQPVHETIPANRSRTLLSHKITLRIPAVVLPVAWRPAEIVDTAGHELAVGNESSVTVNGTAEPGETFVVTSLRPETDPAVLSNANKSYPDSIESRYTSLPQSVPQRVAARTDNITQNSSSPYGTAVTLEQWFRANYGYQQNRTTVENSTADEVLFERERAHSSQLATTMTVMLRTEGIPARYVKGYTSGVPNQTNDTYVVRGVHQHSWVEVYFPDVGWVPFDPTPSENRSAIIGEMTDTESGLRYFDHGNRTLGSKTNESINGTTGSQRPGGEGSLNQATEEGNGTEAVKPDADAEETQNATENGTVEGESDADGAGSEETESNTTETNSTDSGTRDEDGAPRSGGEEQNDAVEDNQTDDDDPGTNEPENTEQDGGTDGDTSSGEGGDNQSEDGNQDGETPEEGGNDGTTTDSGEEERQDSPDGTPTESSENTSEQSDGESSAESQTTDGEQDGSDEGSGSGSSTGESDIQGGGSGEQSGDQGDSGSSGGGSGGGGSNNNSPPYELQLPDDPVPGQPFRIRVVSKNKPAPGITITVDGERLGETDQSGTVNTTIPFEKRLNISAYKNASAAANSDGETGSDPVASRSVLIPTTINLTLDGAVHAGSELTLNATIEGHPVPRGDVLVSEQLTARTNQSGGARVRLPETTGNVTVMVERGAASGERTLDLSPISISVAAEPVALPGRPATVTVTYRDGSPVAEAPVFIDGERVATTDDQGTATVSPAPSLTNTVAAEQGEWRTTTTIYPLRNLLAGVGIVLGVALIAGLIARRLGFAPVQFLRSLPVAVVTKTLVGLIMISRVVDLVWSGVARVFGDVASEHGLFAALREAGQELRAGLTQFWTALVGAITAVVGSTDDTTEPANDAAVGTVRGDAGPIRRAWAALISVVPVTRPVTSTPRDIANRAIAAGVPADAVETILAAFRTVEYGNRDPDEPQKEAVRDALDRVNTEDE